MNETLEKILRWTAVTLLSVTPFVVLIVINGTFFPYITGKNFAYRILVEVVFAIWLILIALDPKKYLPQRSALLYALGAFIAIAGIATVIGENPMRSFWSNYERMEGYLGLLHCAAYFIVLTAFLKEEKYWRVFFNLSLISAVLVSLYGLRQHFYGIGVSGQGGNRIDGTFGNAIYLAGYATFHFFLSLYLAYKSSHLANKIIYGIVSALLFYVAVLTQTRGSMLALVAGVGVLMMFVALRSAGRIRNISIVLGLVLLFGVAGLFISRNSPAVRDNPLLTRFVSISPFEGTGKARLMIWGMALEGVKERPLFGWGQENFNIVFNKYYNPEMWGQEQWFDRAHSVFMDWLVATGILGLMAYLALYVISFLSLFGKKSVFGTTEAAFIGALLVGNFVQSIFVFDNLGGYLTFFMIIGYMHFRIKRGWHEDDVPNPISKPVTQLKSPPQVLSLVGAVLVVAGLSYAIYFFNYLPIKQNVTLIKAITFQGTLSLKNNLAYFREALSYKAFGVTEATEQLLQGVFSVASTEQFPAEERIEYLNFTAQQMENIVREVPGDARYQFFAGALYRTFGQAEKSLGYLQKAIELSPKKQTMRFELISALIDLGKFDEAEKIAKETYELAPEFRAARVFYIISMLYSGHIDSLKKFVSDSNYVEILLDDRLPVQFNKTGHSDLFTKLVNDVQDKISKNIGNNPTIEKCPDLIALSQYDTLLGRHETKYQEISKSICNQ